MLALVEAGIEFRAVFADTGWEAPETYAYLDLLRTRIGPIDVVRAASKGDGSEPSAMVDRIRYRAGFPARMQRWCTSELKIEPLRAYHDALGVETVSAVGIRADESSSRSRMVELDDDSEWGGWIWRPLLRWSVEDVLEIHRRHGVPVNPLYQRGHDRVGCYPCIFARKEEIRLVADHAPDRITQIRELEQEATKLRAERNAATPGRYSYEVASFFQTRTRDGGSMPIDDVVAWSRTARGGKLPLLLDVPTGGCFRWGLCEKPTEPREVVVKTEEIEMGRAENTLSENDEVCTPASIYNPVVECLGQIGLDPCSHPESSVPAACRIYLPRYTTDPEPPPHTRWFSTDEYDYAFGDGLVQFSWEGCGLVWFNPPYSELPDEKGRPSWLGKFVSEVDEGVGFIPVRTASDWWQRYIPQCGALTFLRKRVVHENIYAKKETKKYKVGDPIEEAAAFSQALIYVGPRIDLWVPFARERFGWTLPLELRGRA